LEIGQLTVPSGFATRRRLPAYTTGRDDKNRVE
jgi:hypothetical protein